MPTIGNHRSCRYSVFGVKKILQHRGLRLVFVANLVSMLGSGMNGAAVTWFILQATHTEVALGWMIVLQAVPAMLLMPFSGVIIDREDRRHLVMTLDVLRGVIILIVAVLAFTHHVRVWHVYLMYILVSAGFWVFWPTVAALVQELTPDSEFVHSNTFLLTGIQSGWLIAGAIVGFVYNHIGLGGVLLIDAFTYMISFACYFGVRKGRHVVHRPVAEKIAAVENSVLRYLGEMRDGWDHLRRSRYLSALAISWALFLGAMLTSGVITAPLSDRILHAGAVGYGWLNGGWAVGAVISAFYVYRLISFRGPRGALALGMAFLSLSFFVAPFTHIVPLAVLAYAISGSARGVAGIALSSNLMEIVPRHFMGRVQNTIYFAGTGLQIALALVVGAVAHRISLTLAFAIIGFLYFLAFLSAYWPIPTPAPVTETETIGA